jgi:hypothetical protein
MLRRALSLTSLLAALLVFPLWADDKPRFAGPSEKGFLLPNGWIISPAGKQVILTDLPLNIISLTDGQHTLAATSGFNSHDLALINLPAQKIIDKQTVRQSWFGLAVSPREDKIWWSGGGADMLHTFD